MPPASKPSRTQFSADLKFTQDDCTAEYEVIGVARHSETHEVLIVYRPLHDASGWWVRPYAMFFETVTIAGVDRRRFEPIATA